MKIFVLAEKRYRIDIEKNAKEFRVYKNIKFLFSKI